MSAQTFLNHSKLPMVYIYRAIAMDHYRSVDSGFDDDEGEFHIQQDRPRYAIISGKYRAVELDNENGPHGVL